jgi:hypothetical protein
MTESGRGGPGSWRLVLAAIILVVTGLYSWLGVTDDLSTRREGVRISAAVEECVDHGNRKASLPVFRVEEEGRVSRGTGTRTFKQRLSCTPGALETVYWNRSTGLVAPDSFWEVYWGALVLMSVVALAAVALTAAHFRARRG